MRKIGFIFATPPHGTAAGREGLDAVLASSNYTDQIALFFVGDGVFQLLANQNPDLILSRNYIATFKMLPLCDVNEIYVCGESLAARGLTKEDLVLVTDVLETKALQRALTTCRHLLRF